MGARTIASGEPARQLGELLKEQQEPFILEVYLSERGCPLRQDLTSGVNFIDCHGYTCSFLKKYGSQNKSKKGTSNFPKVVKVLCNKFFTIKGSRAKSSENETGKTSVSKMDRNDQETAEADRFSSASSTTVYNSCSESDIDEPQIFAENSKSFEPYNLKENKATADAKFQGSCMEDSKQHSPVSVLEEISTSTSTSTSRGSPLDNKRPVSCSRRQKSFLLPKLITEDSILSASLWNLLLQTTPTDKLSSCGRLNESQHPDCWSNSSPLSISKRVLQQTKQLLFDCVRELVLDNRGKEGKGKEFLGCEKMIKAWGKPSGDDESNIKQLLEFDVIGSTKEWSDFESQKEDIWLLIGNGILEDITTEMVMDQII